MRLCEQSAWKAVMEACKMARITLSQRAKAHLLRLR